MCGFVYPKKQEYPASPSPSEDFDVGFASGVEEDEKPLDKEPHDKDWTPRELRRIQRLFRPWSQNLLSDPSRVASAFEKALAERRPGLTPDIVEAIRWSFVRMRDDLKNGVEPKEAIKPAIAAEILECINRHLSA